MKVSAKIVSCPDLPALESRSSLFLDNVDYLLFTRNQEGAITCVEAFFETVPFAQAFPDNKRRLIVVCDLYYHDGEKWYDCYSHGRSTDIFLTLFQNNEVNAAVLAESRSYTKSPNDTHDREIEV
jgi:hypothetical protein